MRTAISFASLSRQSGSMSFWRRRRAHALHLRQLLLHDLQRFLGAEITILRRILLLEVGLVLRTGGNFGERSRNHFHLLWVGTGFHDHGAPLRQRDVVAELLRRRHVGKNAEALVRKND